jgi:hypothetical protein
MVCRLIQVLFYTYDDSQLFSQIAVVLRSFTETLKRLKLLEERHNLGTPAESPTLAQLCRTRWVRPPVLYERLKARTITSD